MEAKPTANGEPVDKVFFAANNGRVYHDEAIKGALGTQEWKIVTSISRDEQIDHLQAQINELNTRLTSVEDGQVVPWIRNASSTILHYLIGSQPYESTDSYRFRTAKGDQLSRIEAYALNSGWELKNFKETADGVIGRRNTAVHPTTVAALDELVEQARSSLNKCPRLRRELRFESRVIDDYEEFKKFFPPEPILFPHETSELDDNGKK